MYSFTVAVNITRSSIYIPVNFYIARLLHGLQ